MNERIKQIRLNLKMSRVEFGDKLGISGDSVNNLERGRTDIKDYIINLIVKTSWNGKMVNEEWLRTGDGSMFIELSDNATYHEAAAKLSNDPFVVATLTEYYKRDDNFKKSLVEFIQDISKHLEEHGE